MTHRDRRIHPRTPALQTPWPSTALLRPGREVEVINLSAGGALIASPNRLKPGGRAELQLLGPTRRVARGRIDRCRIVRLTPLRFESAIVFEELFDWQGSG